MLNFKKKSWTNEDAFEEDFAKRDPEYVRSSILDNYLYGKVKNAVEEYTPRRSRSLYGTVIFHGKIIVTSEVLARLAEQGCSFSAYRISYNLYLADQINHEQKEFKL